MSFSIPNYQSGTPQNYTSYSGFNQNQIPTGWLDKLNNNFQNPVTTGQLQNQFNSNIANTRQNYAQASQNLPTMFNNQLQPALQNTMNTMASRGIVNSDITGEAMGNTATGVSNNILRLQQALDASRNSSIDQQQSGYLGNLANMFNQGQGNMANLVNNAGRTSYSQDPYAGQKLFLDSMYRFGGWA